MKPFVFNYSKAGVYHKKNNIVCQDFTKISEMRQAPDLLIISAADGLGSCKYADIASKLACKHLHRYLDEKLSNTCSESQILKILEDSYKYTEQAIRVFAQLYGYSSAEFETTLTTAVYNLKSGKVITGNAGDSAIVARNSKTGTFEMLTSIQRGEFANIVSPLSKVKNHVFSSHEGTYDALLAATDGILFDLFYPSLLGGRPYTALLMNFLDSHFLFKYLISPSLSEELKASYKVFIDNSIIEDDTSVALVINRKIRSTAAKRSYYEEPDWDKLMAERHEKLYKNQGIEEYSKEEPFETCDKAVELDGASSPLRTVSKGGWVDELLYWIKPKVHKS